MLLSFRLSDNAIMGGALRILRQGASKFSGIRRQRLQAGGYRVAPPASRPPWRLHRPGIVVLMPSFHVILSAPSLKAPWSTPGPPSVRLGWQNVHLSGPGVTASAACWSHCRPTPPSLRTLCFIGAEVVRGGRGRKLGAGQRAYSAAKREIYVSRHRQDHVRCVPSGSVVVRLSLPLGR